MIMITNITTFTTVVILVSLIDLIILIKIMWLICVIHMFIGNPAVQDKQSGSMERARCWIGREDPGPWRRSSRGDRNGPDCPVLAFKLPRMANRIGDDRVEEDRSWLQVDTLAPSTRCGSLR